MKVCCNTHYNSTSSEKKVELLARKSNQREREESSGMIRVRVEVQRAERMISRRQGYGNVLKILTCKLIVQISSCK